MSDEFKTMGKIIIIPVDLSGIRIADMPYLNDKEVLAYFDKQIGCDLVEDVMPVMWYKKFGRKYPDNYPSKVPVMLVDEEGLLKDKKMNLAASYFYGMEEHGNPIVGDVIIAGLFKTKDGLSCCGLTDEVCNAIFEDAINMSNLHSKGRK